MRLWLLKVREGSEIPNMDYKSQGQKQLYWQKLPLTQEFPPLTRGFLPLKFLIFWVFDKLFIEFMNDLVNP
jgi:hypothetical protein